MRRSGCDGVEDLAACRLVAHEVVPGSFSELTTPSRTSPAATAVQDVAARVCFGLETARFIRGWVSVSMADVRNLPRVVGCALFRRLACRAGGCHKAREGNSERSTHWHCIVFLLVGHPLAARKRIVLPCSNNVGWARKCRSMEAR